MNLDEEVRAEMERRGLVFQPASALNLVKKLQAQLAEARAVLKLVEWKGDSRGGYRGCPVCEGIDPQYEMKRTGHAPDCRLAKLLEVPR